MFAFKGAVLEDGRVYQYRVTREQEPLRYADVLDFWQNDEAFQAFFIMLLAEAPFSAYRWETPPITKDTVDRWFEFVLVNSPGLAATPDAHAFASHFSDAGEGIVVFENLGGDATLVVPSPRTESMAYRHLAAFSSQAPESQQKALWQTVGETVQTQLSDAPLWLSTAGGGVSWLHVRLDDRPKYYGLVCDVTGILANCSCCFS